jgi:hypothetical protein
MVIYSNEVSFFPNEDVLRVPLGSMAILRDSSPVGTKENITTV